jgi:hypothetical protein
MSSARLHKLLSWLKRDPLRTATYANALTFMAFAVGAPLADAQAWWRYLGIAACVWALAFAPVSVVVMLWSWWACLCRRSRDSTARAILNTFLALMLGKFFQYFLWGLSRAAQG